MGNNFVEQQFVIVQKKLNLFGINFNSEKPHQFARLASMTLGNCAIFSKTSNNCSVFSI